MTVDADALSSPAWSLAGAVALFRLSTAFLVVVFNAQAWAALYECYNLCSTACNMTTPTVFCAHTDPFVSPSSIGACRKSGASLRATHAY